MGQAAEVTKKNRARFRREKGESPPLFNGPKIGGVTNSYEKRKMTIRPGGDQSQKPSLLSNADVTVERSGKQTDSKGPSENHSKEPSETPLAAPSGWRSYRTASAEAKDFESRHHDVKISDFCKTCNDQGLLCGRPGDSWRAKKMTNSNVKAGCDNCRRRYQGGAFAFSKDGQRCPRPISYKHNIGEDIRSGSGTYSQRLAASCQQRSFDTSLDILTSASNDDPSGPAWWAADQAAVAKHSLTTGNTQDAPVALPRPIHPRARDVYEGLHEEYGLQT